MSVLQVGGYARLRRLGSIVESRNGHLLHNGDVVKLLSEEFPAWCIEPRWHYLVLRTGFRSVYAYSEYFLRPLTPMEQLASVDLQTD